MHQPPQTLTKIHDVTTSRFFSASGTSLLLKIYGGNRKKRHVVVPRSFLVAAQLQHLSLNLVGQQGLENECFFVDGVHFQNLAGECCVHRTL